MRDQNVARKVVMGIIAFAFLIIVFGSFGTIPTGAVGIKTRFGAVTGQVLTPGVYFKLPIVEHVSRMDVQIQKEDADAEAASKNLQTVHSKISVNYRLSADAAVRVYSQIGQEYADQFIRPVIQEVVKATTAQYTAEELVSKRPEVSEAMKTALVTKLQPQGIEVVAINIINWDFSPTFNESIEQKAAAEQHALAAKNKLDQVKYEAEQAVEEAKGKAEATKVEAEAIKTNPEILQLRAIEKWDGHMPQVTSGGTPFINIR
jgi:regulator of protease activity HflC (stomatin/prohibitin superfamily)